jgi:uncharacterized protein DUF4956
MEVFKRTIDYITLGSDRPVRRLVAYYTVLLGGMVLLLYFFPTTERWLLGGLPETASNFPRLLQDGLSGTPSVGPAFAPGSLVELAATMAFALLGNLALMLPVTWVYMSARPVPGHNQSVVQTLLILPVVVAGIVLVVRNSLALAFSLAGVVAGVRFRTTLRDARDVVYIFLAIAMGFAAGVQMLGVGVLLSMVFNFILLLTWRYDFGRNVLTPTASAQWTEPLESLAKGNGHSRVPDRDLVLALTPTKVDALAERFDRVREVLGPGKKKPRFNAVLSVATDKVGPAQVAIQKVLDKMTKRWMLDEVVSNTGKPSEIYYLIRPRKTTTQEELVTAIHASAGSLIMTTNVELGEALERERQKANGQ